MRGAGRRGALPGAALAAAGGLAIMAVAAPTAAARGWLAGFLAVATPVLGAVALSLIAGLTGAGWGAPARRVARAAPALLPLWLPVAAVLEQIYPWAGAPPIGDERALGYLRPAFVVTRSVVALGAWAVIAWRLRPNAGRLALGGALAAHAVLVIVVGVDWILSLRPGWMSSDFGMNLGAQQIAAGAALVILVGGPGREADLRDLAALALAGAMGVAYLAFMDYLIVWYGNLPDRVTWYLARADGASHGLIAGALLLGVLAPALLAAAPRLPPRTKARGVALCVMAGVALYQLFLLRPVVSWLSIPASLFAGLLQACVLTWAARRPRHGGARETPCRPELSHG